MAAKVRMGLSIALLAASVTSEPARAFVEDYQIVRAWTISDSSASKSVEVECPLGTSLLGGGAAMFGNISNKALVASQALLDFGSGDAIGWAAEAREVFADANSWSLWASAICGYVPGLERVGDSTASDSETVKTLTLACPAGKAALSGGFEIEGASSGITIFSSAPDDNEQRRIPLGWKIQAVETISTTSNWSLRGQVLCADVDALLFRVATGRESNERLRRATLYCPAGYVVMGGGAGLTGSVVDWIDSSYPSQLGDAWSVSYQRESGETAGSTLDYRVVCPEPGPLTQGLAALAILAARCRLRHGSKRD